MIMMSDYNSRRANDLLNFYKCLECGDIIDESDVPDSGNCIEENCEGEYEKL